MSKTVKVLFLGDLVGRPGREAVEKFLKEEVSKTDFAKSSKDFANSPLYVFDESESASKVDVPIEKEAFDFVIANVENASHGFGLTKKNHDELYSYGMDCMTSGNHIWDKKDIYTYIDESEVLIRPFNYHKTARGVGYRVFQDKIIVINLLGKTFMQPVICPFQALYDILANLKKETKLDDKIIIVDYHAEATAEKICFANFAYSLGVSAVLGTHTHVQTADERLIEKGFKLSEEFNCFPSLKNMENIQENAESVENICGNPFTGFSPKKSMAYITDVGFCGSYESIIGMEYESSLKRLVTSIPERFDVAVSNLRQINAVCIEFDFEAGFALKIKRINCNYKNNEEKV